VLEYLPTPHGKEQKLPERDFFWTVMWTFIPNDVEAFILQVEKDRRPKENLQDKKWNMAVDEEYINELLKYDF
jgi:hypothetical protein